MADLHSRELDSAVQAPRQDFPGHDGGLHPRLGRDGARVPVDGFGEQNRRLVTRFDAELHVKTVIFLVAPSPRIWGFPPSRSQNFFVGIFIQVYFEHHLCKSTRLAFRNSLMVSVLANQSLLCFSFSFLGLRAWRFHFDFFPCSFFFLQQAEPTKEAPIR